MSDNVYQNLSFRINSILSEWNPLDVPPQIAKKEYESYVNIFMHTASNIQEVKKELVKIIVENLGLNYSEDNAAQRCDVDSVADKITEVLNHI